jgi:putative sugar O-methyltransferase
MISKMEAFWVNPVRTVHMLNRKDSKPPASKVFTQRNEFRSDSENGEYEAAVVSAARNQKDFESFKRNPAYRKILENVSEEHGQEYLNIVKSRNDGLLEEALRTVLRSDDVGHPVKYMYPGVEIPLSPTTLRYLKVTSDLNALFGKDLGHIAEIGCGYGGQAFVNDKLLKVDSATLFDLPYVNELISKYLNMMLFNGAYRTTVINQETAKEYDLVISNYAFSELPSVLQAVYIKKVLSNAKRGYLTMNSGLGGKRSKGKLTIAQLRSVLPKFNIYEIDPMTGFFDYLIVWGHNRDAASKVLVEAKI